MHSVVQASQATWEAACQVLKGQLSAPSYETWIAPLSVSDVSENRVVLTVSSTFTRDWVARHYKETIIRAVASVLDVDSLPELVMQVVENTEVAAPETDAPSPAWQAPKAAWTPKVSSGSLNPKYTFDQFVVGNHNRFCHAAALAVAESPAQTYNPLFLYGGVGLGKTHLMHAIGHFAQLHYPDRRVKYVTTEQFTNELIHALGNQDMKNFRDRYRRIDILLIDDIQFLEGKDRTQEEIFHTFNALHQAGKQIVISSDRPPNRLSRLEDRLRSRFAWGLIADIQPADFETRMAILRRKAEQFGMNLAPDVLEYVAESFPQNIRELEGALNKVSAYRMLTGTEIDLPQAQTLLGRRFDPSRVSHEDMIETVARYYHLQRADLESPLRTKQIAHARQVAIYVVRELTDASFPQIGRLFGGRRHTTILYSYEKMKEEILSQSVLKQQMQEILDLVKSKAMA